MTRIEKASVVFAFVLVAASIWLSSAAWPHGLASWIMRDPEFKTGKLWPGMGLENVHCCGPSDCAPYPAENVEITPQGYKLATGELIPFDKAYVTKKEGLDLGFEFWRCIFDSDYATDRDGKSLRNRTRCFWAPGGAS